MLLLYSRRNRRSRALRARSENLSVIAKRLRGCTTCRVSVLLYRFPEGDPSYNLSVTCGDTSPGRRGLGIAQTSSLRQRLPYKGSWREAPERLYHMPRFRFVTRLPEGDPSYNLSVTCGDTSPGRRGFGIAQTSPLRQWLPLRGSWRAQARLRGSALTAPVRSSARWGCRR